MPIAGRSRRGFDAACARRYLVPDGCSTRRFDVGRTGAHRTVGARRWDRDRGPRIGAIGEAVGEVCFNTAMTGYQEILTDPSYAGQIITFTFPHIGNVGTNDEDIETVNLAATPGARGVILHSGSTMPSNYRARRPLDHWLRSRGIIGLAGVDTRALTALIRSKGMPNAIIAHASDGVFDLDTLKAKARAWPGLVGMDLVPMVTSAQRFTWDERPGDGMQGMGAGNPCVSSRRDRLRDKAQYPSSARRHWFAGDCRARDHIGRRYPSSEPGRGVPVQRSRRSRGDRRICGSRDPQARRFRSAGLRYLPRPSDAGHCAWRPNDENAPGPSRRQSFRRNISRPERSRSPR